MNTHFLLLAFQNRKQVLKAINEYSLDYYMLKWSRYFTKNHMEGRCCFSWMELFLSVNVAYMQFLAITQTFIAT